MPPFVCISYPPAPAMHPCIWWKITKFVVVVFWDLFPNTVVVTGSTQEVPCASRMIVTTGSGSWSAQIPFDFTYYAGSWADYEPGMLALRQRAHSPPGRSMSCWPTCQQDLGQRTSASGPRPADLGQRSSASDPRPAILGQRSSASDPQPAILSRRSSASDPQPAILSRRSSADDPQPTILSVRTGSSISEAQATSFSTAHQQVERGLGTSLSPAADMSAFGVAPREPRAHQL
jgi:hypothetical protein